MMNDIKVYFYINIGGCYYENFMVIKTQYDKRANDKQIVLLIIKIQYKYVTVY